MCSFASKDLPGYNFSFARSTTAPAVKSFPILRLQWHKMRIVWDNSRLDLTGSTQKNERKSTAQLGNPMCHVWAESIKTRSGEVSELTESNGDPSGLKGLGTSSRTSLRQTALGFRSYHSSASAGQSTIKNHGAKKSTTEQFACA